MEKNLEKKALDALERQQRAYKRQNSWVAANRERISVALPVGTKERIEKIGETSINGYLNRLVAEDLARREGSTA